MLPSPPDREHLVDGTTPDLETATVNRRHRNADVRRAAGRERGAGGERVYGDGWQQVPVGQRRPGVRSSGDAGPWTRMSSTVTASRCPTRRPAGAPALQDRAGNLVATLSSQTLTNHSPEPVYDTDDDGLIEITTPAQLDAMRHDLDGDGRPTSDGAPAYAAAFSRPPHVVCRDGSSGKCKGYELMADLDFFDTNGDGQVNASDDTNGDGQVDAADTPYWNNGAGWVPIGRLNTTFEGNGHTISHLFINRPSQDDVGLFTATKTNRVIRHIGLRNVEVSGRNNVGGLVGDNSGTVRGSYVTGQVSGRSYVGGVVGENPYGGVTTASYATSRVSGYQYIGGLVGRNGGATTASYATGSVSGDARNAFVGGLVGLNDTTFIKDTSIPLGGTYVGGSIRESYATGAGIRLRHSPWAGRAT